MIQVRSANSTVAVALESRGKRLARRLGLSAAAAMLAGTALVPATGQTYDITASNPGGLVVVSDFAGPPLNGPMVITNGLLRLNNPTDVVFGGDLNDSVGLLSFEKIGAGSVLLSGNNTFSGTLGLRVLDGTVVAGSATALSANTFLRLTPGPGATTATVDLGGFDNSVTYLVGNAGGVLTNTVGTATLTVTANTSHVFNGALQGNVGLRKQGAGTLTVANTNPLLAATTTTGPIILESGGISVGSDNALGTGTLTVAGPATLSSVNGVGAVFIDNNIVLDANLTVIPSGSTALRLNGDISGVGSLTKTAAVSTLRLAGDNSYLGGTSLLGGRVEVGSNTALSTGAVTAGNIVLALLDPAVGVTLANNFVASVTMLTLEAGNAGTIFGLSGEIAGTRRVVLGAGGGPGVVQLSGNNSYTGATRVLAGVLGIGSAGAVANTQQIQLEANGTGIRIGAPGLTIDRGVTSVNGAGTVSATIDTAGVDAVFSGRLHDANSGGADFLALTKTGAGILTVSNASAAVGTRNIVSGGFGVDDGTLNLTGRLHNDVTANGGTLAGTGVVSTGTTTIGTGGTLSPGDATVGADAIGTLTLSNLTLTGTGALRFDLGAPSIDTVAPINDLIVVNGNLNLGGVLNVNPLVGFAVGTYRLLTYTGTLSGQLSLGTLPNTFVYDIVAGSGVVDLNVLIPDYYWDGTGPFGTGTVEGGSGDWTPTATNWTDAAGNAVVAWGNQVNVSRAFFQGTAGTVRLTESRIFEELHFLTDGYIINPEDSGENLSGLSTTINVDGGVTATVNVAIDGADGLTKIGGGTLNFGNANTYSGGTFITAGRININNSDGLGTDGVVMSAGTTLGSYIGQVTLANNITINGGVTFDTDNLLRLNGVIDGSGGFTKTGAGELAVAGANTFTGDVNINAGQISLLNSAALGNAGNVLNLAAGINLLIGADIANNITTATANGIANDGNARTLGGIISGDALITFSGAGNTTLNGANTFTGGSNITAGTVTLGNDTALGTNAVTMANGTTLGANTNVVVGNGFTIGNVTIDAGANTLTLGSSVGGAGLLTKAGSGTLVLNGNNSFSGGTALTAGSITAGTNTALGGGALTMTGGTTLAAGVSGLDIGNAITTLGVGTIDSGSGTLTLAGVIDGSGSITKIGSGDLVLSGVNTYAGGTALNAGSISINNNASIGTGALTTTAGTTLNVGIGSAGFVSLSNDIVLGNGGNTTINLFGPGPNDFQIGGGIGTNGGFLGLLGSVSGDGGLSFTNAGVVTLSGDNSYTGGTEVGSEVGVLVTSFDTVFGTGRITFNSSSGLSAGSLTFSNDVTLQSGLVSFGGVGVNTFNGVIDGAGTLRKTGDATLVLGGANLYTGGTNLDRGTLDVRTNTSLGNGTLTAADGTSLIAGVDGLELANAVTLNGSLSVDSGFGPFRTFQLSGDIAGTGSINKINNSTLILSGNSNYSGGTNVAGTLQLNSDTGAGTGAITLNGSTLATGANLTLANAVTLNGGGVIATNQFSTRFEGIVGGAGGLTVTNVGGAPFNGVAILANANNDFAGGLTIAPNASVSVAADGALGAAANGVTINEGMLESTGTFTSTRGITLAGAAGQINVTGAETLTLTGQITGSRLVKGDTGTLVIGNFTNNYNGGTLITGGGTLAVADSNVLGNAQVDLESGTLASVGAGVIRQANSLNIAAAGTFITIADAANTLEWNGVVSGVDNFTKTGAGTLRLNAINSYSGTIQLTGGEIDLEGSIAGGINAGIGTRVTGTGTAAGASVFADGGILSPGNSPGTVNFGSLVLSNGTNLVWDLDVINTVAGTNDLVDVDTDLTLDGLLQVQAGANFNIGVGSYTLFQYGNLLADNGVVLTDGALPLPAGYNLLTPPAGVTYGVTTSTGVGAGPGNVLFNVAYNGTYFFDGNGTPIDGIIQGGPGTWNGALTNFTNSDGFFNLAYADSFTQVVQFGAGPGGTSPGGAVTVEGARQFGTINFTDNGYVLGGAGTLNVDNGTIDVGGNTATINNQISGIDGLTKAGAGTLILNGNNDFTGGLAVTAGTVRIGSDTALGGGNATFAATTTLQGTTGAFVDTPFVNGIVLGGAVNFDANGGGTTINGIISGNGPLSIFDVGPANINSGFDFRGPNTFLGDVSVTNTLLIVTANNGLGNAANSVTLNNAILATQGSFATNRSITLTGTERILTLPTVTLTANGAIGGAGQLVKDGSGTLVLGNAGNSYGGGTVISNGVVSIASDGALGAGGTSVSFSGASLLPPVNTTTLQFTADVTSARDVAIAAGFTGTIDTVANTVRLDGTISGDGTLTKIGTGRLTLTGTNTYAGGTNLNAGTLQIDDGNAIGTGTLTTQGGTTLVAGLTTGAGTITLAPANNIVLAGGQTTIDMLGSLLIINPVTGAVSTNGTRLVIDSVISGAGGFTTSAATAGQIVLNASNSFTGNVNLNSAVAVVNNDNALGMSNTVNINQAAGIRNNTGGTTRTIASNIAINDPNATVGGNGNLLLNGVLSGDDTNVFNKVGLGTVTLANAANSIAAQIEVAQGELAVTGALTNANQLTNVRAGATLSGTGSIAGIVDVANAGELSAGVGGNGQVGQLTIGTLLLNEQSSLVFDLGDAYVNGGPRNDKIVTTNLRLGGRLTVRESQVAGASFGLGVYNLLTYQGALLAGSTNVFVQTLPGAFTGTVQTLVPGQVNLVVTNPGTFVQYWDGGDTTGGSAIADGGSGTWSAGGSNWTGVPDSQLNTNWVNGSVAVFAGTAGTVTLAQTFNAQMLQFATDGYTLTGGLLDNQSTGVGTGMIVHTDAAVTATIDTQIQGDGLLFKQGAGTLALGGSNGNFSGGTRVENGTLQLNTALAAGTGSIALLGNTTLASGGGTLSVANAVVTTGANTIDSAAGSFTLTNVVSGIGSLTKVGAGTLTLSGANSYTDGTTIAQGTLAVTNNASIGTGALTINGGTTLQAAANGVALINTVALNGLATVDTQANGLTLSGTIGDGGVSGTLVKIGSGNLTLSGTNTYSGGTNLTAGTITVANSQALGTGTLTATGGTSLVAGANGLNVGNDATLLAGNLTVNSGTGSFQLSGDIGGVGGLTKVNSGNLILSGGNTYEGGTGLTAGSITVLSNTALGIGTLTATGGTSLVAGANGLNVGNAATLLAGNLTVDSGTGTFQLSGGIGGVGGLAKVNSGNLILSGNNGYEGGTGLIAGTITVNSATALGTGTLTATGGTSLVAGANGLNVGNAATLLAGNLTVDSGTGTFQLSGAIGGVGGITKVNSGTLILSGNSNYSGGTALTAGTIQVNSATALGTGTLTATGGTSLVAGANGLNVGNAATLLAGNLTVDSGTGTFQLSGAIGGVGGITKVNSGNLILSGNSSYSGGTALTAGSLTVTNNGSIGTGTLTTSANTTVFAGLAPAGGSVITLANAVVLNGATTLDLQGTIGDVTDAGVLSFDGTTLTLNGVVSGAGPLTVNNLGRVNLNGDNSHSGGTTLNFAAAYAGTDTAFGTGAITLQNGILGNDSGALRTFGNAVVLVNDGLILGPNDITLSGDISGTGQLIKRTTSTLTLNGDNSYSGDTELVGGTIVVGTSTALGTGTLLVESIGQATSLRAGAANLTLGNAVSLQPTSNLVVDSQGFTFGLDGFISGDGALTKVGTGTLILSQANAYGGGTALNAGTIQVGSDTALGTSRLTATGGTSLVAGVSGLNAANAVTLLAGTLNVDPGAGAATFQLSGNIDGVGGLTKVNSGTLLLSGNNSFAGGVNLNSGTITVLTDTALGAGTLTAADGTSLVAGVSGLNVGNAVVLNGGLSVDSGASPATFQLSGVISGAGSLTKVNSGNLTLSGVNTYTGGTNLNAGSLTVTNNSSIGTGTLTTTGGTSLIVGTTLNAGTAITLANAVSLGAGTTSINLQGSSLTFNNDATIVTNGSALTLNGVVSGVGTLATGNFGSVTLNGNNSYSGGTLINTRSQIYIGSDTAVGTGTVTMSGATGLYNFSGATRTLANAFVLNGGSWLGGTSDLVLNGVISGTGTLIKAGADNLTLNGLNSYNATSLRAGTITVGTSSALGTGTVTAFDSGLTKTLAAGTTGLTISNLVSIAGASNLIVDSGTGMFTLAGTISGTGSLTKVNSGNLVLNGANSFSGGSFINTGTVTVGTNTALGTGLVTMADGTTLANNANNLVVGNAFSIGNATVATGANSFTLSGVINGAGLLTKTGSGTLILTGANGYTGGTALTAGTITVGSNTALGTGTLTMSGGTSLVAGVDGLAVANGITTLGVGTVDTGAFTFTLSGVIDGAGSISKIGSGNLVLNGASSFTGGSSIAAGTVTVGNNAAFGTGLVTLADGTTLANNANNLVVGNAFSIGNVTVDTGANSFTLAGVVSGAGQLTKVNRGTLVLNGANDYTGGTALLGGTIRVGNNAALGTGALTMNGGTTLAAGVDGLTIGNAITTLGLGTVDTGAFTFTLGGVIDGEGSISKTGTGNLVLTGANLFTGGITLNAGTITVGSDTALGIGALTLADGTTLAAGANTLNVANDIATLGLGTIDTGANSFTLSGVISGDGSIAKAGTGTVILTNANSYIGGTALNAGTITVANDSALGTGTLAMADGTTLNTQGSLTLANAITTAGVGSINTDARLTLTLNGVISGDGSIAKTGAGLLIVNGDNSYAGGTALNAGSIRVGSNTALGTGAVAAAAGTVLQAGAAVTLANNVALAGGLTVDNFGQLLGLGGVISGTGPLSVIDGTGGSAGVLTLSGVNSYTGGTVITGTTVSVSQNANLGNVAGGVTLIGGTLRTTASFTTDRAIVLGAGGGRLAVATGTTLTSNGVISGTSLTKNSGTLVLNGASTYTGGTSLNAGTIIVGNNAALGTGTLAMADGTTLGTKVNVGTTTDTQTVTLANAVTTAGFGTFNADTGLTLVLNGVVSGAGSVNKTGAGVVVLNGANSYSGGTTLVGGTIRAGSNTAVGTGTLATSGGTTLQAGAAGLTLANAVALGTGTTTVDTQAFGFTLSGVASGAGAVSKIGSGVLNLTGASTYTGATTVAAGTLNVTGSLVSAVTVNSGAAINGTGTVGALNVLAGGSVNPGTPATTNSATLTVTGAATLAGTYTVNATPAGTDRITAGGALTLGGTLAVVPGTSPAFSQFGQTFTVASGATRTGTFATVTGLDQFGIAFNPVVDYTATQANIRLAPQSLVTLGNRFGGISGNQLEVALAFDRAVAAGYNPQAFFNVYAGGGSALPQTLRQMSGEQRATERRVVLDTSRVIRESALDRLNGGLASLGGQQVSSSDGDRTLTFWLRGAGSWAKSRTSGAATAFTAEQRGVITGIDWAKAGLTVGGAFHYTSTNVEYQVLGGSSNVETVGGTVYAGYRQDGGLVANGGVSVAGARTNGSRAISLPSFAQSLAGRTNGTTYQFFGELAWDLAASADTRIEPFARLTHVKADMGGLTETGGVAALVAAKQGYDITVTNLGARFGGNVADGKVALSAAASWQNTSGDRAAATVIGIPAVGQNGLIRSVQMDRDAVSLQADVGVNVSSMIRFSLGYSGLIGKSNDDHGGRATLNFAF